MAGDSIRYHYKYDSKGSKGVGLYKKFAFMAMKNPRIMVSGLNVATTRRLKQYLNRKFSPDKAPMPHNMTINVTRRCNLSCKMCVQHRQNSQGAPEFSWYDPKKEISVDVWEKALDEMRPHNIWLGMTGGEPTVYPGIKDLVMACTSRSIPMDLSTNGTTLDTFSEFFVKSGMEMIFVSIDGPEEIHDEIRGIKGSFKRTINGLETLVKTRDQYNSLSPVIIINTTISKMNLAYVDEVPPISKAIGADLQQLIHTEWNTADNAEAQNRIVNEDFCKKHGFEVVLPSLPIGEFYETEITEEDIPIMKEKLEGSKKLCAKLGLPLKILPNLSQDMLHGYYLDPQYPFSNHCNSLWQKLRVLPDGTVSPCMHLILGNIKDQSIESMWNGESMRTFRRLISNNLMPICFRCCSRDYAGERIR